MPEPKGRKDDTGRLRFDLLPVKPLEQIANIYTYGANKYDDNNWRSGMQWGRVFAATMRHLWTFWRGEDLDQESGLPHLAHAAFGCLTLLEYMETHRELDDRVVASTTRKKRIPYPGAATALVESILNAPDARKNR